MEGEQGGRRKEGTKMWRKEEWSIGDLKGVKQRDKRRESVKEK